MKATVYVIHCDGPSRSYNYDPIESYLSALAVETDALAVGWTVRRGPIVDMWHCPACPAWCADDTCTSLANACDTH